MFKKCTKSSLAFRKPAGVRRGPALGGPGFYRFYVTHVPGPCMRHHNVPNDLTLGSSAGGVQNKRKIGGVGRSRSLASLQSAQRAAGAPRRVGFLRGEQQSRPSPSLLRCFRCTARVLHIKADVEQRSAALRPAEL